MSLTLQRLDASSARLDSLDNESKEWFELIPHALRIRQYHSRLKELQEFVKHALANLRNKLGTVTGATPVAEAFRDCRVSDLRATWLRRIWRSYADRFDQRREGRWKKLLEAADEVIWSCYQTVRLKCDPDSLSAPPLAYVDDAYSPAATLRRPQQIPPEFDNADDRNFVDEMLRSIPVPLIVLPAEWNARPWWMVLLAHETAHHLQQILLPVANQLDPFERLVGDAAKSFDTDKNVYSGLWKSWSCELFADALSVPLVGSAAVEAIAMLSWSDAAGMGYHPDTYPPASTRLEFLNRTLLHLKLPPAELPGGITPIYIPIAHQVAATVHEPIAELRNQSLSEAAGFDPGAFASTVRNNVTIPARTVTWTKELVGNVQPTPQRMLDMPRYAVAASWRAWRVLSKQAGSDLDLWHKGQDQLATASLELIANCGEPSDRSSDNPRPMTDLATRFLEQFSIADRFPG